MPTDDQSNEPLDFEKEWHKFRDAQIDREMAEQGFVKIPVVARHYIAFNNDGSSVSIGPPLTIPIISFKD